MPNTREIIVSLTLGLDEVNNVSISLDKSSGTMSFNTLQPPAKGDYITIQGVTCKIMRSSPTYSNGERWYKAEGKVVPVCQQDLVAVNFVDWGDGSSYKVSEIVAKVAGDAGASVSFSATDNNVQSFEQSGRYVGLLGALADLACGELILQGDVWKIVPKNHTVGSFNVDGENILSVKQSYQDDVLDSLADLAEALDSAQEAADILAEEIAELEKQIAEAKKNAADANGGDDDDDDDGQDDVSNSLFGERNFLGEVSLEFGWIGKNFKPVDSNILTGSYITNWDEWTPELASVDNPAYPSRKYFKIDEFTDSDRTVDPPAQVLKYRGLYSPEMNEFLYPIEPPSNSAGLYYGRGKSHNLSGLPIGDYLWSLLETRDIVSTYVDSENKVHTVTKTYIVFRTSTPIFDPWWNDKTGAWSTAYDPERHKIFFRANFTVEYIPKISSPWKFAGTLDFTKHSVVKSGVREDTNQTADLIVGMIDVDGNFFDTHGGELGTIESLDDLPGDIRGPVVLDSSGQIAGRLESDCYFTSLGDYAGTQEAIAIEPFIGPKILLGSNSATASPVCGWVAIVDNANLPAYVAYPGLGGTASDKKPLQIYFSRKMPSAWGIDFTGFDPANPDAWTPLAEDPNDNSTDDILTPEQIKELEDRKKEKEQDAAIQVQKISCIERELSTYNINVSSSIDAISEARKSLRDEEKRQADLKIRNVELLKPLQAVIDSTKSGLMATISAAAPCIVTTDCSFIYSGVLPMPNNELTIGSLPGDSPLYDADAGIVDSVSLTIADTNCSVSVTATKRIAAV